MDGSGTLYEPFTQSWAQRSALCVVRYRPDLALQYADLIDLAERDLPATGELVLLGESFSGPVAIALAERLPHRVIGLVLCCSFCRSPHPHLSSLPLSLLPMLKTPASWIARWVLGRYANSALTGAIAAALKPLSAATLRARLRAVLTVDKRQALAQLQLPLLYLQASSDRLVPDRAAAEVSVHAKRARTEVIEGAHFLLQTSAHAAAESIAAFIEQLCDHSDQVDDAVATESSSIRGGDV